MVLSSLALKIVVPEEINKIFDRFYRPVRSGGKQDGFGLGLPICRGIIRAHGGEIWVKSEIGAGSKFSFSLPTEINAENLE